jgi:hypothetical protein
LFFDTVFHKWYKHYPRIVLKIFAIVVGDSNKSDQTKVSSWF